MRREHFAAFQPLCPVCRSHDGVAAALVLDEVSEEDGEHIVQGTLACPRCTRRYPIIDAVPVIIGNLREWIQHHLDAVTERWDLAPATRALLGDGMGPGTLHDTRRSHLSSYGWGHWGDLDPNPAPAPGTPARLLHALAAGLEGVELPAGSRILDAGCAVGRSSFALAQRYDDALVLGLDLSFSFLRVAAHALRHGEARYPLRRVGIVYDERRYAVDTTGAERVDFWCADAQSLPFVPGIAALATSLNLVDCVPSPREHLESLRDVVAVGGTAVVATPFDWSPSATELAEWIGGHAQLGPLGGRAELAFDALVGEHPFAIDGFVAEGAAHDVPWSVRLHDRSAATYEVRVRRLRRA